MGIIDFTRGELDAATEIARQLGMEERARIVDSVMYDASELLEQPSYEGDLDQALIHHFGRSAFESDECTKPFIEFASTAQEAEGDSVPMLLTLGPNDRRFTDGSANTTVFMVVNPQELKFRSETSRRDDVKMYAFTDETAGVTDKKLSLQAKLSMTHGNLAFPRTLVSDVAEADELVLSESHIADDGHGRGIGTYQFGDSESTFIQLDDNDKPYAIVGWEAIEKAALRSAGANTATLTDTLLLLNRLFSAGSGSGDWKKSMPTLASKIEAVTVLLAR